MGIGAIGVEQGLMNDSVPEILTDRALRRMARSVIVVADASKFERVEPGHVFGLGEVDVLVTDDALPPETLEAVRSAGVRVVLAPTQRPRASAGPRARAGGGLMVEGMATREILRGAAGRPARICACAGTRCQPG